MEEHRQSGDGSASPFFSLPKKPGFYRVVNGVKNQVVRVQQIEWNWGSVNFRDHSNRGAVDENFSFVQDLAQVSLFENRPPDWAGAHFTQIL
jgi:hypothetical protein